MTSWIARAGLAALLTLAAASPAAAAPDRTLAISAGQPHATWQGAPTTSINGWVWWDDSDPATSCGGVGVDLVDRCDQTLVEVTGAGKLDVAFPDAGDGYSNDWDLFVYQADAKGTPGALVGSSETVGGPENLVVDAADESLLVVAVPYQAVNSSYSGALSFTPAGA